MNMQRTLRHLSMANWRVQKAFPAGAFQHIEQEIARSELGHLGRIRFVVESALPWPALWRGQSAHERAVELFSRLHVWDTEHNNGILIYLQLADRALEIVADRGILARVDAGEWKRVADTMAQAFRRRDFETGVIDAVRTLHLHLHRHFPRARDAGQPATSTAPPQP